MSDDIVVRIRAEGVDEFTKELKKTGAIVEDTGDKAEKTSKKMSSSFSSLGKVIGGAFATAAVIQFGKVLAKTAIEIDATGAKVEKVFGSAAKDIDRFAKQSATSLGLTSNEFKKAAANAGDLLVPLGIQRKEAAKMSAELITMSGALSAWTGGQQSATEVSEILTKALLGEREQLKTLGINIMEADVSQRLLEKGQKKLTGTALAQAKAFATLELITEKSADAQAAFADDTKTLAEQQLELSANIREFRDRVATALIPILNDAIGAFNKGVRAVDDFLDSLSGADKRAEFSETISTLEEYQLRAKQLKLQIDLTSLAVDRDSSKRLAERAEIKRNIKEKEKELEIIKSEIKSRKASSDEIDTNTEAIVKNTKARKDALTINEAYILSLSGLLSIIKDDFSTVDIDENLQISPETQAAIEKYNNVIQQITPVGAEIEEGLKGLKDQALQITKTTDQLRDEDLEKEKQLADQKLALREANAQGAIDIASTTSQLFGTLAGDNAKAQKANAAFEIGLNTSIAITKALTRGPIIGPILAAVIAGLATAQLSQVLSTPIPQFAKGTKGSKTAPEGFAWVGEDGPELMQMKGGEKIITNADSEKMMKLLGGYGIPVQFKTTYEELYKPMSAMRALAEGTPVEGIDWNPLLNSNDRGRRSSGKKLDRIYEEMVRLNRGLSRKMTRA